MNNNNRNNLKIFGRSEGKIKSHDSCLDIRAWSHDVRKKNTYLREWIRSDMPMCILPIRTLTDILKTMTLKCRKRVAPRCYPECRSKIMLESISASCQAMRECLKTEKQLSKYFEQEDFESSHWPCEKVLDVFKTIKMFWKIIVEKIINVQLAQPAELNAFYRRAENFKDIAREWERDIIQQSFYVKHKINKRKSVEYKLNSCDSNEFVDCKNNNMKKRTKECGSNPRLQRDVGKKYNKLVKKVSKGTFVKVKFNDVCCATSCMNNKELDNLKDSLKYLQEKYNIQNEKIELLKQENSSLRRELQRNHKNCDAFGPVLFDNKVLAVMPKPFEESLDNDCAKTADSEMVITMENSTNEMFKHISILQVLHKTNDSRLFHTNSSSVDCRNENPIELLSKVQTTVDAIVKREIHIVGQNRKSSGNIHINAGYYKKESRVVPSTTFSSVSVPEKGSTKNTKAMDNMSE